MSSAPAGWYPHPDDPTTEYWWDGNAYTQSRPVQAAAPTPTAVVPASVVSGVATPIVSAPVAYRAAGVSPKSRTVASLLSFFLGGLGVDRFYLGNIGLGVAKLLVGWLTFGIWPLIDFILVVAGQAHDGDGLAVVRWE